MVGLQRIITPVYEDTEDKICHGCGYSREGIWGACPECGMSALDNSKYVARRKKRNRKILLVCGIVTASVICPFMLWWGLMLLAFGY